MTRRDQEYQASKFMAWHTKRGQAWEEDFAQWSASKDFMPADYIAIKTIVLELLTSEGPDVTHLFGAA